MIRDPITNQKDYFNVLNIQHLKGTKLNFTYYHDNISNVNIFGFDNLLFAKNGKKYAFYGHKVVCLTYMLDIIQGQRWTYQVDHKCHSKAFVGGWRAYQVIKHLY